MCRCDSCVRASGLQQSLCRQIVESSPFRRHAMSDMVVDSEDAKKRTLPRPRPKPHDADRDESRRSGATAGGATSLLESTMRASNVFMMIRDADVQAALANLNGTDRRRLLILLLRIEERAESDKLDYIMHLGPVPEVRK